MGKKKIYKELSSSFIWFLIDELILKHFGLYPILNTIYIYNSIVLFTKLHPHIMLLLTIIGIIV